MLPNRIRILVFEGDPEEADQLRQMLADSKQPEFQTECISSINQTLNALNKDVFDVILFSLAVQDSENIQHLKQILAAVPDIPIIVRIDQPDEQSLFQISQIGIRDSIVKGHYDNQSLIQTLFYNVADSAISKLRRAEETIRKKELELSDTQQLARIGSWRWDIASNKLSWSDELYRICGLKPQAIELTRETFYAFIHPDDLERVRTASEKARKDLQPYNHTFRIVRADGTVCFIQSFGKPIVDQSGALIGLFGTVQDITELKEAEEKLRSQENLMRAVLEETTDTIFIKDLQGRYLLVNKVGAHNFGKTPEELIGKDNTVLDFPPETANQIREADRKVILKGETLTYEIRVPIEGIMRTFLSTKGPYRDHKGKIIGVIAITRDITDRKMMEEKLRSEHAFRKPIEDSILAGIGAADLNGKIIYVNPALCKMLGWTEEELIGLDPPHPFWPPDDKEHLLTLFQKRLSNKEQGSVDEIRLRRRNGEIFPVMALSSPLTDGHGNSIGILAAFYDITDRKRAEESLSQTNQMLQGLIHASPLATMILDLDGIVRMWSPAAERIFGWREGEVLGRFLPTAPEEKKEEILDNLKAVAAGKEIIGMETTRLRKGGIPIDVSLWAVPLIDKKGNRQCLSIVSDISEKKRMEENLLKIEKLEALGVLAGGIAHDFNNILTGILGNISLAKTLLNPADYAVSRLNEAEKASLRATELARQLLTFAKGGNPVKTVTAIQEILESSVRFVLRGSNIQSKLSFQEGLWPVEIDAGQITQVIQNLLINARQAMSKGGTIEIKVRNLAVGEENSEVQSLRKGNYLEISIQDEGIGIPKELLAKIFDPYFTTKQEGSGLGLAISHSIIKRHDGFISVKSKLGKGTTFFLFLPATPQGVVPRKKEDEPLERGSGSVLIMDDEESILDVSKEMLKALGYKVELARSGTEAVAIYKKSLESGKPFNLVITDLTVPGDIGGIEVLKKLKKMNPRVKVIVSSGYSNDPVMSDYENYGFSYFLSKPFKMTELGKTLKRALGDRRKVDLLS